MQLHIVYTKDSIEIYEDNSCAHHLGWGLPSFLCFCTTKQNEYKFNAHMALAGTINLTLSSFYALISLVNWWQVAKHILPCFLPMSLWLKLPGYGLDTDALMLIGYCITRGCPNPNPFMLIGWLKHMTICNWEWANYHTRTFKDHSALVMSKPKVII